MFEEISDEDCIFNNDVTYMKSLLGRKVKVTTTENKLHVGYTYVIDPIFKTLVLTNDEGTQVDVILHHAIKSLDVTDETSTKNFSLEMPTNNSNCDDPSKKQKVMEWLKNNFINITEDGPLLKFDDKLVIIPPYGPEECLCSNTIILERIQEILRRMPN